MARTHFDQDWKDWVRLNVERGCSKDELFRILVDEGFEYEAIRRELNHRPSVELAVIGNPLREPPQQILIPNLRRLRSPNIELYTADKFLDPAECEQLIALIKARLRPSEISVADEDKAFRTSRTCDLYAQEHPAVERLDAKICAALQMSRALAEPTQGQHYDVAQQFKPHTDYFETFELERYSTATLGQRTWTFMIYLNEPLAGGATAFPNAGALIRPKTGMAVIWNNLSADGMPNPNSLHQGMPVEEGYKVIITKWFRMPRRQG